MDPVLRDWRHWPVIDLFDHNIDDVLSAIIDQLDRGLYVLGCAAVSFRSVPICTFRGCDLHQEIERTGSHCRICVGLPAWMHQVWIVYSLSGRMRCRLHRSKTSQPSFTL